MVWTLEPNSYTNIELSQDLGTRHAGSNNRAEPREEAMGNPRRGLGLGWGL